MAERQERARLLNLSFSAAVLLLAYAVYLLFRPFLIPLAWAGVLVVCCYPAHAWLLQRVGPNLAASLSTTAVACLIIVPAVLIGTAFVREATGAVDVVNTALTEERFAQLESAWRWAQVRIPGQQPDDLGELLRQGGRQMAAVVATGASGLVRNAFVFLFNLIVMLFATYFLFRDAGRIVEGLRRALPFRRARTETVLAQARDLIQASVIAGLAIATLQGAIGGVALALLGFTAPVFWGVVMGLCSFLPIFGSSLVWAPASIYLIATGGVLKGFVLIGVGVGVVGMVDNVVRPILISERSRMNGLLVFISLLGGASAFGLLGVVLGPIIVATALTLFLAYTEADGGADDVGGTEEENQAAGTDEGATRPSPRASAPDGRAGASDDVSIAL